MDQVFLQDFILIQGHPIINLQRRKRLPVPTSGNLHQINARQTKILFSWSILCAQHFPLPCNITASKKQKNPNPFRLLQPNSIMNYTDHDTLHQLEHMTKMSGQAYFLLPLLFFVQKHNIVFYFSIDIVTFFFEYGEIFFTIDDYPQYCDNHRIVTRSYRIHIFVIHMSWKSGIILQSVQWTDLCFQGILLAWKKKLLSSKDIARLVPIKT